jgi:hypothetical protein
MRHFVLADLRLDPGGDRPSNPRNHDKAAVRIHLGAAQRTMRGHYSVHGVTEVLDLREGALSDRHRSAVAMPVNGWRGINRINWFLRQGHHRPVPPVGSTTWVGPSGMGTRRTACIDLLLRAVAPRSRPRAPIGLNPLGP